MVQRLINCRRTENSCFNLLAFQNIGALQVHLSAKYYGMRGRKGGVNDQKYLCYARLFLESDVQVLLPSLSGGLK
jgi:hypothetical protein